MNSNTLYNIQSCLLLQSIVYSTIALCQPYNIHLEDMNIYWHDSKLISSGHSVHKRLALCNTLRLAKTEEINS